MAGGWREITLFNRTAGGKFNVNPSKEENMDGFCLVFDGDLEAQNHTNARMQTRARMHTPKHVQTAYGEKRCTPAACSNGPAHVHRIFLRQMQDKQGS
eukprot:scaffold275346_cov27-Tisochrysis_lutea.AAC.1